MIDWMLFLDEVVIDRPDALLGEKGLVALIIAGALTLLSLLALFFTKGKAAKKREDAEEEKN